MELLRRYTELPYVMDYLITQELVLLNPANWDDRNDSFYIEEYARRSNLESVYALCLAQCAETYHHWRIFSHGSSGACIQFDPGKFREAIAVINGLQAKYVQYETINSRNSSTYGIEDLPFLKRYAFIGESEFRLFYATKDKGLPTHRIKMPLSVVDRVVLSPWLPKTVVDNVKKTLKMIDGCSGLKIYQSTLIDNEQWKKLASS